MNRQNLIQRLVNRKMQSGANARPICICICRGTAPGKPVANNGRVVQSTAQPQK